MNSSNHTLENTTAHLLFYKGRPIAERALKGDDLAKLLKHLEHGDD